MSQDPVAKGLRVYTVQQLVEAYARQRTSSDWDFSKEREFIENLLCQRFNFLLIIYSVFIAGAASTTSQQNLIIILCLGAALCSMIGLTIWRVYVKLIVNLRILHQLPSHAFEYIQREVDAIGIRRLFGVNSIIGVWVPLFCTLSLGVGAVLAVIRVITVE